MTLDHAVALSCVDDLSRVGLTARLHAPDPELLDLARRGADAARARRESAAARGIAVLPWNDPRFPPLLLSTTDCPPALWIRGDPDALRQPAVAVVGSRAASVVALETAAALARDLAARGATVVSGLARGVDSAAHRGALERGRTVAVLGSGLERIYPREHAPLAAEIAGRKGLLISEYPPDAAPLPFRFPMRNRIISGLSLAVVVIEASDKSGSLITAGCALEQGREVMAVPGNVLSGRNKGGHALLRDGARLVETAEDVFEELGLAAPVAAGASPGEAGLNGRGADGSVDPVLAALTPGQPSELDAIAAAAGLDAASLLPRLCALELDGRVRRVDGGRFIRSV